MKRDYSEKFDRDAKQLLEALGGRENIQSVTHCATRLRFVIANTSKTNLENVQSISSVKGTFTQAGQFQVIIGNDVAIFYQTLQKMMGKEGIVQEQQKKSHQTKLQRGMTFLAEIFAPLIPAIIMGGMILGIRNYLDVFLNIHREQNTMIVYLQQVKEFLEIPSTIIFQLLPVGMTWSITKKMGTTQILGIILGLCLVFNAGSNTYTSQLIPAILSGSLLAFFELQLRKFIPESIAMIVVPFFAFIPALWISMMGLAPFGLWVGHGISYVMHLIVTGVGREIAGIVFGAFYTPLVITGLHHVTNLIDLQLQADYGGTGIWPMIALANISQASAALAIWWEQRKVKTSNRPTMAAVISCSLGITEPALFGINLQYRSALIAGVIGSAIAGGIATYFKVTASTIGVGGIPGILVIQPNTMMPFLLCLLIASVVPFICTLFFSRKQLFKK